MGNSVFGGHLRADVSSGTVTKFYTPRAWIDGRAEHQVLQVADLPGVHRVAAFPDLHPGQFGPVGCAVLADRIYPHLIGTDIGCGMGFFALDLPARKLKLDKALRRMRVLGEPATNTYADRLGASDLSRDRYTAGLGTVGGGNHFCEVQTLIDAGSTGLDIDVLYLLVHSGSRGFGQAVFSALPDSAVEGLTEAEAQAYVQAHDQAVRWARLNRQIIAERAAEALRTDLRLICDVPHNILTWHEDAWLHRKGAAEAQGGLIPLAGSRATPSYLMQGLGHAGALGSLAHGAGRRYDRRSMHGRQRSKHSDIEALQRNPYGGRILCEDRDLLIEEAPLAYKSAESVMADLEQTQAARRVGTMHPLLTFKAIRCGRRRKCRIISPC